MLKGAFPYSSASCQLSDIEFKFNTFLRSIIMYSCIHCIVYTYYLYKFKGQGVERFLSGLRISVLGLKNHSRSIETPRLTVDPLTSNKEIIS